jgi:hypothetical protein
MRAATKRPREGATAHRADDAVKMPRPTRKALLRPARSAHLPAGTSRDANTMVYALNTHDMELNDSPWKLFEMLGKAIFTMNRSSEERKTPVSTTIAVNVGWDVDPFVGPLGTAVSCFMRWTLVERVLLCNVLLELSAILVGC